MALADPLLHRLPLRFRDPALEADFRAAEGARPVRIMRLVSVGAIVLAVLAAVAIDVLATRAQRGTDSVLRLMVFYCLMSATGVAATFTAPVLKHPQWAVVVMYLLFAAAAGLGLRNFPPEFVQHRGFMILVTHLFGVYSMFRLRFIPAAVAGTLSVVIYAMLVATSGLVGGDDVARHVFWLSMCNLCGMWICYQLDLGNRREFAARQALDQERARSEGLLLNILPAAIAARLKDSQQRIAEHRDNVTVLFADLAGFTSLSARKSPADLVALLDRVFTGFDALAREHGLEKIKTIGDAYMAVAGMPQEQPDHALRACRMAVAMVEAVRQAAADTGEPLHLRLGLHSGPVVAGVIGRSKFSYDLWGDTVNTASRMESLGLPGRVQCTAATAALVASEFALEPRGPIEVKGKGAMETFLLSEARVDGHGLARIAAWYEAMSAA